MTSPRLLDTRVLHDLAAERDGPQLSLYMETHKQHPENAQDPIRFRGLTKNLHEMLEAEHSAADVKSLLAPFFALGRDEEFWNHTTTGLAVFGAKDFFQVVKLTSPARELTVVADSFHIKPLRRLLQTVDRFQVLALSRDEVKLYEGDSDGLFEVELEPSVVEALDEALESTRDEPHQSVASFGSAGGPKKPTHNSLGGGEMIQGTETDRYFRAVDREVLESYSRPSGLPLILAALPEHHHRFHEISHNPLLHSEGLEVSPTELPLEELCKQAAALFESAHRARVAQLTDDFMLAESKGLGVQDLEQAASAAAAGRVATLLIDADRELLGHLDGGTGAIRPSNGEADETGDDVLDDLGELVAARGGRVVVLPTAHMPTKTGLAAVLRF